MNDRHNPNQRQGEEDETLQRLLKAVGSRKDAPADIKQKWATTLRLELDDVIYRRRRRRKAALVGIAASIFFVGLVFTRTIYSPEQKEIANLIRQSGDAYLVDDIVRYGISSSPVIFEGSILQTPINSYLAINYRNAIVRLNQKTAVKLSEDRIHLLSGELYIDNNPDAGFDLPDSPHPHSGIWVETPSGSVRDIGTQFLVKYIDSELETSVRHGAIELDVSGSIHYAEANKQQAESFKVLKSNEVQHFTQAANDESWEWIHKVTPGFDLEGSSTYAFLQWSCAEIGLQLEFASQSVRVEAEETILHGELPQQDIHQAIKMVMATTAFANCTKRIGSLRRRTLITFEGIYSHLKIR